MPDSRSAIFKDKSLSLLEKNQLMRFFKLVQRHLGASDGNDEGRESSKISEEDLESPFVEFLKKMRLPPKIKLYRSHCLSLSVSDSTFFFPSLICLDKIALLYWGIEFSPLIQ